MKKSEKGLSAWHLTMLALGTVIGGSFFLGSAVAIKAAGPAIVISYFLGGLLVYLILYALSEMTVANPDCGSFRTFASQVFGKGTGFVVGWVYWSGMVLAMSSEATAVSILVRQWFPEISIPILGSTIIIGITLLNLLGASKLSRLESYLALIKILAIISFIIMAFLLIIGLFPGKAAIAAGDLTAEPFMPNGIKGIAGSMLIVIFTYAGFEVIGLAASEAHDAKKNVPKAINFTVLSLVGLYILTALAILPLIPTSNINQDKSPIVAALTNRGITWTADILNIVLITAILSTILAAMFGLGRMMRSLASEKMAPKWLKDKKDVPYKGILFSGLAMVIGLWFGLLFPSIYLFLISSGGFALLFTYAVIMATHIKFRKKHGCPPDGKCQMRGYPYTSIFALIFLIVIIFSMPFVAGQASGLFAGLALVVFFILSYLVLKLYNSYKEKKFKSILKKRPRLSTEFSKEHRFDDIRKKDDDLFFD